MYLSVVFSDLYSKLVLFDYRKMASALHKQRFEEKIFQLGRKNNSFIISKEKINQLIAQVKDAKSGSLKEIDIFGC